MPIKRIGAPESAPTIKRVQPQAQGEYVTKEALQDHLVVITMRSYEPDFAGSYGVTPKAVVDIIDTETGERHYDFHGFGNLGKQLGSALQPGEVGAGRIVTGPTKDGRNAWWGFEFAQTDEDYARAEEAVRGGGLPF